MAQAASIRTTEGDVPGSTPKYRADTVESQRVSTLPRGIFPAPVVSSQLIEMMCLVRRDRQKQFPGALGSDSCWDILLQLYRSHLDQHRLHISQLTARTGLPGTTALRSLETLRSAGLVDRSEDPLDRRKVVVGLSSAGIAAMHRFFVKTGVRAVLL